MIDTGVPAVVSHYWQAIERRARQIVTRAPIRVFVGRDDGVQAHLEFAVIESRKSRRVEEQRRHVLGTGGSARKCGAEATRTLFA